MKTCGWTGAVLVAVFTGLFLWSNSSLTGQAQAAKPASMARQTASAEDLSSGAGMRYRFSQPRHWRHVVLGTR